MGGGGGGSLQAPANLLRRRSCLPYLKKRNGNGTMASVRNATSDDAHCIPRAWYICVPKSGNAAVRREARWNRLAGRLRLR